MKPASFAFGWLALLLSGTAFAQLPIWSGSFTDQGTGQNYNFVMVGTIPVILGRRTCLYI